MHALAIQKRPKIATVAALLAIAIVGHIWFVFLAPTRWGIFYPGGVVGLVFMMVLAIGLSAVASILGGRRWYLVTLAALATFVYIGFFVRSNLWS